MIVLETAELGLLHHVGHERSSRAELRIDIQQAAQRRELNFFNITRTVAAKFPIVSERKIDRRRHRSQQFSHRLARIYTD